MKKSLLALAVLGAFAGAASAQSSVTLFGVVDLGATYSKQGSTKMYTMTSNQLNSNRLGFRGVEDLGGGLKAGFWLEAGMENASGVVGNSKGDWTGGDGAASAQFFNRRSTVSLSGNFGEVRLGRDFTPSFRPLIDFDVYSANGFGEANNLTSTLKSGAATASRSNNEVEYFLPSNLGGLYGDVAVAAGEGATGSKMYGGHLGFASGPFNVGGSYSATKTTATTPDFKRWNIGGSWDFTVVKVLALVNQDKWGSAKDTMFGASVSVPIAQSEIRAGFYHAKLAGVGPDSSNWDGGSANSFSAEYIYNMSKRTALYAQAGEIRNKGNALAAFKVIGTTGTVAGNTSNNKSDGLGIGLRHSF